MRYHFGLLVTGKAKTFLDGKVQIGLCTSYWEETDNTPVFDALTTERFADIDTQEGKLYDLTIYLSDRTIGPVVVAAPSAVARLGGLEIIDEDESIRDAALVAKVSMFLLS